MINRRSFLRNAAVAAPGAALPAVAVAMEAETPTDEQLQTYAAFCWNEMYAACKALKARGVYSEIFSVEDNVPALKAVTTPYLASKRCVPMLRKVGLA